MKKMSTEHINGYIIKKEYIATEAEHILPGTFVLKIGKPFPGMYKDLKIRNLPEFYFLVLQENYSPGLIIDTSEEINRTCKYGFNAVAGEITVSGKTYPVIRIKNIMERNCINELQMKYIERGFHFSKNPELVSATGMVKIIKYFTLEEVGEGIYFDRTVPELGYIEIPRRLEWELFEDMTCRIKVNVALGVFDAAIGIFYMGEETNIIRIFNPVRSVRNLALIKNEYLARITNPELMDKV